MDDQYRYVTYFRKETEIKLNGEKKKEYEGRKGSGIEVIVVARKGFSTKVRRSDGEIVRKVFSPKLVGERAKYRLFIDSSMLDDIPNCKRLLMQCLVEGEKGLDDSFTELGMVEFLGKSASRFLISSILHQAVRIANGNKGKKFKLYELRGAFGMILEDFHEEEHVLGLVKKETRLQVQHGDEDDDNDEDCSICMMKLSTGSECARTPCSHIFHYKCILPWLTNNYACPNCRSIVR